MGNLYFKLGSLVCSLSLVISPSVGWAQAAPPAAPAPAAAPAAEGPAGFSVEAALELPKTVAPLNCVPSSPLDQATYAKWMQTCSTIKQNLSAAANEASQGASDFKATLPLLEKAHLSAAAASAKATPNVGNSAQANPQLAADASSAMGQWNGANGDMEAAKRRTQEAVAKFQTSMQQWNSQAPLPQTQIPGSVFTDAQGSVDAMAGKVAQEKTGAATQSSNLMKALKVLGVVGAIGGLGYLALNAMKGDDDAGTPLDYGTPPDFSGTLPTDSECPANTTKNEAGLCVVNYAQDCADTTQLRNTAGVCVAKNDLCETGRYYDDTTKTCKISRCEEGFIENNLGVCTAKNAVPGGTIDPGAPDPITGIVSGRTGAGTGGTSGGGSSAGGAAAGGSDSSRGSLRSAAGGAARGFASTGGAGGGAAGGGGFGGGGSFAGGEARSGEGKDAQVQYQPLKWTNPKLPQTLRDSVRSK